MNDDVRVYGDSGRAVLLLPGGAASCAGFFPGLVEGLRADPGCRVIVHDRPGTGTSTTAGTLAEASSHLHRLIGSLGVGPVVVVGQSLGGAVAALLARDHPEDVAGVVLLDPTPFNDERFARGVERGFRLITAAAGFPPVRWLIARSLASTAEKRIRRRRIRPDCAEALREIARTDFRTLGPALTGITELSAGFRESELPKVPAVILGADRKPGSRATAVFNRLAEGFGGSVVVWPGATHSVHLEYPEETLDTVRDVVRRSNAPV